MVLKDDMFGGLPHELDVVGIRGVSYVRVNPGILVLASSQILLLNELDRLLVVAPALVRGEELAEVDLRYFLLE